MPNDGDITTKFWYNLADCEQIKTIAQFRMGSHWLNVEQERCGVKSILRSKRLCKCCSLRVREDELHVLSCPLYHDLRRQYGRLFVSGMLQIENTVSCNIDAAMRGFMNAFENGRNIAEFWDDMANFLIKSKLLREQHLLVH